MTKKQSGSQIRQQFLEFFRERAHEIVPSAPVYPQDDPTLLFTNAGMNQFKDVFLGTGKRSYVRCADTQKCLRVSGKHNDLDEVGRDTYHHTLFEMLGNWSFGDYFKREAIEWAWEFLTEVCELPKERLWATYFGGDEKNGLPADEETRKLWCEVTDIDPKRVLPFDAKDNFWEMGATGPCGPCSEIHIDRGGPDDDPADGADMAIGVNAGNERFIEIWNLVFIQFNRQEDGSFAKLPAKHVDTGMGLERLAAVMNEVPSNYDTDLFQPIFRTLEEICGVKYTGGDEESDIAFRVIADHTRALCVGFADGVLPSNVGRGYVLRRILRRAARFGRQALDLDRPFIHELVPVVADMFKDVFPEIGERRDHVTTLLESEERTFGQTLDKGLALFSKLVAKLQEDGAEVIPGDEAFDLYATYGFPQDLVSVMSEEVGMQLDLDGWAKAEEKHRGASQGAGGKQVVAPADLEGLPATVALYHEDDASLHDVATAKPLKLVGDAALVLDRTPFYAEAGGQIGDAGKVRGDGFLFAVEDTKKIGQITVHLGQLVEGDPENLPAELTAEVDVNRRTLVKSNHTATHLLHWALRKVLGDHVTQQGSWVGADRLRFDATHPHAITPEEVEQVEELVNAEIARNHGLVSTVEDLDAAKERGVTALFGEKYEQEVRVVNVGGFSQELCGGTHVTSTGDIGSFAVVSESAIQAGVRRIEAVTGAAAVRHMQGMRRALRSSAALLKGGEHEVPDRIQQLLDKMKELKKARPKKSKGELGELAKTLLEKADPVGDVLIVTGKLDGVDSAELGQLINRLRGAKKTLCGVLGIVDNGKPQLAVFATDDLAPARIKSGDIIGQIAPLIGGGGGGSPTMARAGGKNAKGVSDAVTRGGELLRAALG